MGLFSVRLGIRFHLFSLIPAVALFVFLASISVLTWGWGLAGMLIFSLFQVAWLKQLLNGQLQALPRAKKIVAENFGIQDSDSSHSSFEIIQLAFDTLQSKNDKFLERIQTETSDLANNSQKTSQIILDAHVQVSQQESELNQVATAVNEMAVTIQEVARMATDAAQATHNAKDQSVAGALAISEGIGIIESLSQYVNDAENAIQSLAEDSNNIGAVLDVIKSIAEQTNLLALNAAIEAARAGEQGRGFAVVADEVRTLASRTQKSTEEIHAMIQKLQNGSQQAVEKMSRVKVRSQEGASQIEQSAVALSELSGVVKNLDEINTQIASAAEEQSAVSEEINKSIVTINNYSIQSAQHADRANEAIKTIEAQILSLKTKVSELS